MFIISKIVWWLFEPANLLTIALVLFCGLLFIPGFRRIGRRGLAVAMICVVLVSVLPIGVWLLRPLENRFPPLTMLPEHVTGMISLGGAVNQFLTADRGKVALNGSAERLTAVVSLAQQYPELRLVYTGGSGSLLRQDLKEAAVARRFYAEMGLDPARVLFEDRSRNTYENALRTAEILRPSQGREVWVLVTSAAHMPRAVGVFRKAGFTILPYPVDYATSSRKAEFGAGLLHGLGMLSRGVYAWSGLIAYRILGRTDSLLPGP